MLTRSGVAARRSPASRFPPPTASAIAWRLGFCDSPSRGGVIALGARASRPHPFPLAAAELQCNASGSHPVGGNRIGQAEGKPWRRSRLIQVGEMDEAVAGFVRAGRPRSQEAVIHTLDREHGLHHAKQSGKKPCASLKNHSPPGGGVGRQGRSPQASRRGVNAASRE